jgi:hypothetical protein
MQHTRKRKRQLDFGQEPEYSHSQTSQVGHGRIPVSSSGERKIILNEQQYPTLPQIGELVHQELGPLLQRIKYLEAFMHNQLKAQISSSVTAPTVAPTSTDLPSSRSQQTSQSLIPSDHPLKPFVDACIDVKVWARVRCGDVAKAYKTWSALNVNTHTKWSHIAFSQEMKKWFPHSGCVARRFYAGIQLTEVTPPHAADMVAVVAAAPGENEEEQNETQTGEVQESHSLQQDKVDELLQEER